MSLPFAWSRTTVAVLVLAVAACECDGGPGTNETSGRLEFDPAIADFGPVILGQQGVLKVTVRNTGRGGLRVNVEPSDPFPSEMHFTPTTMKFDAGDAAPITLFFNPTEEGPRSGILHFRDPITGDTFPLEVKAIGVKTDIAVTPSDLEFGPVLLEEVAHQTAKLENRGKSDVDVSLDNLSGDDPEVFRVIVPGTNQRLVRVAAGAGLDIDFTFQPVAVGPATAQVKLRACTGCPDVVVRLGGRGVAAGLVASPDPLDFGPVLPQSRLAKPLTFRNVGNRRIAINSIRPERATSEFSIAQPSGGWPALDPTESGVVQVTYSPIGLGTDSLDLVVETDDARSPSFKVRVMGYGGGPEMALTPQTMDFGKVAIGFPVVRRLTVSNRGLNDTTSDSDDLVITALDLPSGGDFSVAVTGGTLPLRVAPGTRQNIEVRYDPRDADNAATAGVNEAEDIAELKITSNDSRNPTAAIRLRGEGILAAPCDLDVTPGPTQGVQFGVVARGRSMRQAIRLLNTGVSDCVLGKIDVSATTPAAMTIVGGPVYGKLLPHADVATPGVERLFVEVDFSPPGNAPSGTNYVGALELSVNSVQNPDRSIPLKGRGAEVCLSITPAGVDFGVVRPLCETNDRAFTIYNACRTNVKIDHIDPGAGTTAFRIGLPPSMPRLLQPQQELRFNVRYKPQIIGADQGTVEVYTDQTGTTGGAPYVLTLSGRGDDNPNMVETFTQADRARADILFVVDDSGSMSEEQATLGSQFQSFMRFAISQGIDYHLALTTTSIGSGYADGKFVASGTNPKIVTPALADPETVFRANVNVGTDGDFDEQGLEGAYRALSEPNINGANAGFLRPDAYLSVIIVSDEEDSSTRPLDFYVNFFQNIKGPRGANLVSVSGIVGTDPGGCSGTGGEADYGQRYVEAARRTSGITESICNDNWNVALQKLGLIAFGYKSRFILTSEPDLGSVRVFIDGEQVPEGPLWTFTADANAVDFLPTAVPPAGAEVRIEYTVACHLP